MIKQHFPRSVVSLQKSFVYIGSITPYLYFCKNLSHFSFDGPRNLPEQEDFGKVLRYLVLQPRVKNMYIGQILLCGDGDGAITIGLEGEQIGASPCIHLAHCKLWFYTIIINHNYNYNY